MAIGIGNAALNTDAGGPVCSEHNAVTVKPGDTLSSIASQKSVSLKDLLEANPQITDADKITAGQVIYLPASRDQSVNPDNKSVQEQTETPPQPGSGDIQGLDKTMVLVRMNQCGDPSTAANPTNAAGAASAAKAQSQRDKAAADRFLNQQLEKVSDPKHPLHFLVEPKLNAQGQPMTSKNGEPIFDWRKTTRTTEAGKVQTGRYEGNESGVTVQVGHQTAFTSGAPEQYTLEDADLNQLSGQTIESRGSLSSKPAVEIGGVPVDLASARQWERMGSLPEGTVANSPVIAAPEISPAKGAITPEPVRGSAASEPSPGEQPIGVEGSGTQGAVEGAGIIIQDGINSTLNRQELDKADAEYERLRPEIDRLNREGQWVAVVATVDVPKVPDLMGDVAGYHDPRDLPKFKFLSVQHGATRAEALNPRPEPPSISAAPPLVGPPPEPIEMPQEGRKWIPALYTISPPASAMPDLFPGIPGPRLR
jgi:LysM repeat protein